MCYSPVCHFSYFPKKEESFNLHALDMPPAFILSQDQTLNIILDKSRFCYDVINYVEWHNKLCRGINVTITQ